MIDAAILVGGRGSRLGKIIKYEPKPLLKIGKNRFSNENYPL
jgi:NDP-sugar pyrophosphorylase family protein